jgi:hypothetical protein
MPFCLNGSVLLACERRKTDPKTARWFQKSAAEMQRDDSLRLEIESLLGEKAGVCSSDTSVESRSMGAMGSACACLGRAPTRSMALEVDGRPLKGLQLAGDPGGARNALGRQAGRPTPLPGRT